MRSPLVTCTTVVTLEWPLFSMLDHVKLELGCIWPTFPTCVTQVSLLPRVLVQMPFKVCFLKKSCVPQQMCSQAVFCCELFPAVGANTRLLLFYPFSGAESDEQEIWSFSRVFHKCVALQLQCEPFQDSLTVLALCSTCYRQCTALLQFFVMLMSNQFA